MVAQRLFLQPFNFDQLAISLCYDISQSGKSRGI